MAALRRAWVLVVLLGLGCASTQVAAVWKNPGFGRVHPQKVLVVGMYPSEPARQQLEVELAGRLRAQGIDAVPSSQVMAPGQHISSQTVSDAVKRGGFDTVLTSRFEGLYQQLSYFPGAFSYDWYVGFWGPVMYEPAYYTAATQARVETSLFDARRHGELVWTVTTETFNPRSTTAEIPKVASTVVQRLNHDVLG